MRKYILEERYILNEATDWNTIFDSAKKLISLARTPDEKEATTSDLEAKYDDFYKETFGQENVKAVKNLGVAVKQELEEFGYTEKINPFISFIKVLLNAGFNLNSQQYGSIHNGYIDKQISANDLMTAGGILGKDNIIRKKDFYDKSNRQKYLALQQKIIDWLKNNNNPENKEKAINTLYTDEYRSRLKNIDEIKEGIVDLTGKIPQSETKSDFDISKFKNKIYSRDDLQYSIGSIISNHNISESDIQKIISEGKYSIDTSFFKNLDSFSLANTYNNLFSNINIDSSKMALSVISSLLKEFKDLL